MLAKYVVPLALAAMFTIPSHSKASGELRSLVDFSQTQPLIFTSNEGQWDEQVHFRADVNDATMWFVDDGFYYQLVRDVSQDVEPTDRFDKGDQQLEYFMIRAVLIGANESVDVEGERLLDYRCHYFLGSDPSRWRANVPSYEAIVYREVYPGIDMKYYYNGREMEYDFILAPGADPSQIQIRYEGADAVAVTESGELEIVTAWGAITQTCPYVYQQDGSKQYVLEGSYMLSSDNSIGFVLNDNYNPDVALVIDPIVLFSSYLGGNYTQAAWDNAIDSYGNVVIVGETRSLDFPVIDAYQDYNAGSMDLFVTKIDPWNHEILYSTYFGGSLSEGAPRVALDDQDNICMVFRTASVNVPTVNPYQSSLQGDKDAFVIKLSADGDQLLAATYLGGDDADYPCDITVDSEGSIYICGETASEDSFPLHNACFSTFGGGVADGFVAKLNSACDALVYSTFLGGSGGVGPASADDVLYAIAVNAAKEAYVAGATYSDDFPAVNALYEPKISKDGPTDAVIAKFSQDGSSLVFSTFFGGTEDEWINDIAFDASGNVVMVGSVESDDFPTLNAYQTWRCPGADSGMAACFVATIAGDGSELLQSTYFGGCNEDFGEGVAVGQDGAIYITGYTFSDDFPIVDPLNEESHVTEEIPDAFVAKLNAAGSDVYYSTYFGGSKTEQAKAIAVDGNGWLHITGFTMSDDLPLVDPTQTTGTPYAGGSDAFVLWMKGGCCKGMTGNMDGDPTDRLDILDVTYSVDWYFRHGSEPDCRAEADVDGNGYINIEDLVYLVNYIFWSGPAPAICGD